MAVAERSRVDLVDVLSDALDEFEEGVCDLASLVRDVASTIDELAPKSDRAWIAELRGQWEVVAGCNEQRVRQGNRVLSESELQRVEAAINALRPLLRSH